VGSVLVVVVNYDKNKHAIKLKQGFEPYVPVCLIDSGSKIAPEDEEYFDDRLPNVFYNGLVNQAFKRAVFFTDEEPIVFICSDVIVSDFSRFVERVDIAFSNNKVQVYAPSSKGSGHPQMWPQKTSDLRRVNFVEGFCFAARKKIFAKICPIDLSVNRLGWGVDIYFSYQAICSGGFSVVDDCVTVFHPQSTGYNTSQASNQERAWYETLSKTAKFYRSIAAKREFRAGLGCRLLMFLIFILAGNWRS